MSYHRIIKKKKLQNALFFNYHIAGLVEPPQRRTIYVKSNSENYFFLSLPHVVHQIEIIETDSNVSLHYYKVGFLESSNSNRILIPFLPNILWEETPIRPESLENAFRRSTMANRTYNGNVCLGMKSLDHLMEMKELFAEKDFFKLLKRRIQRFWESTFNFSFQTSALDFYTSPLKPSEGPAYSNQNQQQFLTTLSHRTLNDKSWIPSGDDLLDGGIELKNFNLNDTFADGE